MPEKTLTDSIIKTGGLSGFGGMAFYLYQVHKGEQFTITGFIINILLAFFVGYIVGEFLPTSLDNWRNGIISVSGFITYPLLNIIETKLPSLFEIYLDKKIGGKK